MARTIDQPSAAIRPNLATAQLDTEGPDALVGPGRLGEGGQLGGKAQRRENLTAVRPEPDHNRDDSRGNRDDERRDQPPTLPAGMEAFAPVLEAWKQVFRSWSELGQTMMKAQQDALAGMIGAVDTTAKEHVAADLSPRHGGNSRVL